LTVESLGTPVRALSEEEVLASLQPLEGVGAPIRGPRALTDDWRRFWHLTFTIARNEFKLRFFGSMLGYVWQLVRPLLLFGVLLFVFSHVVDVGRTAPHYAVTLLAGIVLFTFFGEATGGAIRSVVDRENLVRKIHFPRLVIPLAVVLIACFNLALNLLVVLVFALVEGVRPMVSWVEAPLIIGMLIIYCTGLAMLLSALFVHFRDIQPIWEVFTQVMFYASGILVPLELVRAKTSPGLFHALMLNPLAIIVEQFRHAMIDRGALSAGQVIGGCGSCSSRSGSWWRYSRSASGCSTARRLS